MCRVPSGVFPRQQRRMPLQAPDTTRRCQRAATRHRRPEGRSALMAALSSKAAPRRKGATSGNRHFRLRADDHSTDGTVRKRTPSTSHDRLADRSTDLGTGYARRQMPAIAFAAKVRPATWQITVRHPLGSPSHLGRCHVHLLARWTGNVVVRMPSVSHDRHR